MPGSDTGQDTHLLRLRDIQAALQRKARAARWQVQGPISVRDNSEVYRAVPVSEGGFSLALKVCLDPRTGRPDRQSAVEQFRALRRVHAAMGRNQTPFHVPQPLCIRPHSAGYAMQWVDGLPLEALMNRFGLLRDGARWFNQVGQWLGHFHACGPMRRSSFDPAERLAVAKDLQARPLPEPVFARALHHLQKANVTRASAPLWFSWLHGDCKAENFFLGPDQVWGLDISLRYENPVEYDLAQFLNNLALVVFHPRRLLPALRLEGLEVAFLEGYGRTGPEVSLPHLRWLRLSFALSFWHSRAGAAGAGPRAWLLRAPFQHLVTRLLEDSAN